MAMGMGIDPQKLQQMQQVSQHIKARIAINYKTNSATIELFSENPQAVQLLPELLSQFAGGLATQLNSFFAIKGEIVEIGKK